MNEVTKELRYLIRSEGKKTISGLSDSEMGRVIVLHRHYNRSQFTDSVLSADYGRTYTNLLDDNINPLRASLLATWACTGLTEMFEVEVGRHSQANKTAPA